MKAAGALVVIACAVLLATSVAGQIALSRESLSGLDPGEAYSPCAERRFPSRTLWADTYLRTGLVDVAAANRTKTIGGAELGTVWIDPDFEPNQRGFYDACVLEIPTPRWIVYDAFRYGVDIPGGAQTTHQERADTSPIWYTPGS